MKRVNFLYLMILGLFFAACSSNDDDLGDWAKAPQFSGVPRSGAVCFKIGEVVYVGLGADVESKGLKDFWKLERGSWSQVADFPGTQRWGAVAFVINGKAYVGTGYQKASSSISTNTRYKDFWQYDPVNNVWDSVKAEFPGEKCHNAVGFALGNTGYVGTGSLDKDNVSNLFYSFTGDAESGTWTKLTGEYGYPGDARQGAVSFIIKNQAYVCLGSSTYSGSGTLVDVYRFDPTAAVKWTRLRPLVNTSDGELDNDYVKIPRTYGVAFAAKNFAGEDRAYVTGGTNGTILRTCFEYNPDRDVWEEMTALPAGRASAMIQGIAFSLGNYGYVGLGGSSVDIGAYKDLWKFYPGIEEDEDNDYAAEPF